MVHGQGSRSCICRWTYLEMRPLAHYTTTPWRHAAKAERPNRTVSDGARAALIQAALGEEWWTLALLFWIALYNGFMKRQEVCTPYWRRYGVDVEYKRYPFGLEKQIPLSANIASGAPQVRSEHQQWRCRYCVTCRHYGA